MPEKSILKPRWSENIILSDFPKAKPVEKALTGKAAFREGITMLGRLCEATRSVALSAVQIGEPLYLVVSKGDGVRYGLRHITMLNPRIVYFSKETFQAKEFSASMPGVEVERTRPFIVGIKYRDRYYEEHITYLFEMQAAMVLLAIEQSLGLLLTDKRPHPSEVAAHLKEVIAPEDFDGIVDHAPKQIKMRFKRYAEGRRYGESKV
jgi:peptide deformylase